MNPHGLYRPQDFRTATAFAAHAVTRGSQSGLSLLRRHLPLGAARPVSTPSLHNHIRGLGSGLPRPSCAKVSPTLSGSAPPVSRRALNFQSSPERLPIPPPRLITSRTIVPTTFLPSKLFLKYPKNMAGEMVHKWYKKSAFRCICLHLRASRFTSQLHAFLDVAR